MPETGGIGKNYESMLMFDNHNLPHKNKGYGLCHDEGGEGNGRSEKEDCLVW